MSLPTYFIARSDRQNTPHQLQDVSESVHVVDAFRLSSGADRISEWIVTVNGQGALHAIRAESRDTFPETLQSELAYQELISSNTRRLIHVHEFYLIAGRYLDQPAQAPGPNDPVHLYGTLYGPYRDVQDAAIQSVDGQLTLTRADVLEALIHGSPHAFRYPSPSGDDRQSPRCLHMMVPADREEAIVQGRGVAIAYLLMPSDLMLADAANELLASQTIYELLSAIKQDLRKDGAPHALTSMTLPVPSRGVLERQLQSEGYTIQGEEAIKQSTSSSGFTGFLAAVFGANEKRLALPPEGKLEDFLRIAHATLTSLAGWPTTRAVALRRRLEAAVSLTQRPVPKVTSIPVETTPSPIPVSPTPAPPKPAPPTRSIPKDATIWKKPGSKSNKPEWMDDFEEPTRTSKPSNETVKEKEKPKPAKSKPDWMKDFE